MAGLSVARVKAETRVGFHADATRGLYLQVAAGGTKSWVYRYQLNGKRRLMGLGPCTAITLQEARDAAHQARRLVLAGTDPIDARRAARSAAAVDEAKLTTFADCFDLYLKAKEPGWKGTANSAQWRASMATYALPLIGKLPVASVDTALVMKVVEPIWLEKRVTADRVRRRIEAVIDYAVAREYRPAGDNPARWKGHLANLLTSDTKPVEHLAALPYAQIPEFMAVVRDYANARPSVNDPRSREEIRMAARALEFLVLTATRSDQVLGAKWGEFDLAKRVWTVPAERMKGRKGKAREHLVPLSDAALAVLGEPGALDEFVFPSASSGKMYRHTFRNQLQRMGYEVTPHGFRSTFRDWCAERGVDDVLAEMALAHDVGTRTERAYRRTTMFEKRRQLAERWALYCTAPGASEATKVVTLRR